MVYLGSYLSQTNAFADAVTVTRRAVDLFREHDNQGQLAWSLENLALRHGEARQFADAATAAGQSAQIYAALADPISQGRLLVYRGSYLSQTGDATGAVAATQQAIDLFREHDNQGQLAWSLENLALRHGEARQFADAATAAGQSAQIYAALGNIAERDRMLAMQASYVALSGG